MTRINTNMASLLSRNALNQNQGELASAMQRLSTGLRINSAKDDAAGLAISEHMASQIRGLNMAMRNANDGVSLVQTSDGATQEIANMLQRMRELALQSLNDTSTASDRAALDTEYQALKKQMAQINSDTTWNGVHVLNPQQSLRASVVPATISGKGPTDTSSPVDADPILTTCAD
jgi:flagellin